MSSWYYLDNDKENNGSENRVTTVADLKKVVEEKKETDEKAVKKTRGKRKAND